MNVKICGITRLEDARKAAALGAWAVGFIFYPKSPRYIAPEAAAAIVGALPAQLLKVGVFVDASAEQMKEAARLSGITHYQLHGRETPETAGALDLPWFKVFRLVEYTDLKDLDRFAELKGFQGFLFDAPVSPQGDFGGTGKVSNWILAAQAKSHGPVILSGGLNASNAREARAQVAPFAIDLSSGVESAPGIKDHQKIEELFHELS